MSQIDDLPPLRDVIAELGLTARKELGQNFLLDLNLTSRIARSAGDLTQVTVIEVGPGPGGLTRALLAEGAKKVIAIERDERALPALQQISVAYDGRLEVICGDAMEVDFDSLCEGPYKIVANLPYNIATPLLTGWLTPNSWPPRFESLTLMFQKEVAERICAPKGSKTYGRLSVLASWRANPQKLFDVSKSAFTPPPKVTSSIVHLQPRTYARDIPPTVLETVTRAAFGQRRKMIRQSLKGLPVAAEVLIQEVGLKGTERAEQLSPEVFLDIAEALIRLNQSAPANP